MWQQIGLAALGAVGVPALLFVWVLILKPKTVHGWGRGMGSLLSAFGQKKVGRENWEKIENRLSGTISDFISGMQEGMDSDDNGKGDPPWRIA